MRPSYYVKFTGKFKDLKPLGYCFWKAFASNYRVYSLYTKDVVGCEMISVWQHRGSYVDVDDFQEYSYLLVKAIQNKEHLKWKRLYYSFFERTDENYHFYVNTEDCTFMHHGEENHKDSPEIVAIKMHTSGKSDEEIQQYRNKYRNITLTPRAIAAVEQLLDLGMIEISDEISKLYRN